MVGVKSGNVCEREMSLPGYPKGEEFVFFLWETADRGDTAFLGAWVLRAQRPAGLQSRSWWVLAPGEKTREAGWPSGSC